MKNSRTPYNSIYEALMTGQPGAAADAQEPLICCCHGNVCDLTENGKYFDLMNMSMNDKEMQLKEVRKELTNNTEFVNKAERKKNKAKETNSSSLSAVEETKKEPKSEESKKPKKKKSKKEKTLLKAKDSLETANFLAVEAAISSAQKKKPSSQNIFIGTGTYIAAEEAITRMDSDFCFYYRLPTASEAEDLEEELYLYLAYKINSKNYRHFRIRERKKSAEVYIDYGNPRAQGYKSIEKLGRALKKKIRLAEPIVPIISEMEIK